MRTVELSICVLALLTEAHTHDMSDMTNMMTSAASTTTETDSDMAMMMNVFHTGLGDSLFWTSWKPTTKVAYAFTFLALVLLGMMSRALSAYIIRWDRSVRAKNMRKARTITISSKKDSRGSVKPTQGQESTETTKETKEVYSSISRPSSVGESRAGLEDEDRPWSAEEASAKRDDIAKIANAWRISVDVPRGLMQFLSHAIGFLMMLAVMTGNLGYFFAVLVGIFIGEVGFGRIAHS